LSEAHYIFTSERLGFRAWHPTDLEAMSAINADEEVMRYFESTISKAETRAFINRMNRELKETGHCYFAVEILESETLIGCIGLSKKNFKSDFTPCVDIGWRLGSEFWGKGYATEGAKRCLEYAFSELNIHRVFAITPVVNKPSVRVMEKIGMEKHSTFIHPNLKETGRLNPCFAFKMDCVGEQATN
jgi:RimJ/RimL family protein N-acetyltransferase